MRVDIVLPACHHGNATRVGHCCYAQNLFASRKCCMRDIQADLQANAMHTTLTTWHAPCAQHQHAPGVRDASVRAMFSCALLQDCFLVSFRSNSSCCTNMWPEAKLTISQ
jgi:hypothetical protein